MEFPGVALVTGAASGIGRATALRFAEDGCTRIAIADVNAESLESTRKSIERNKSVKVKAIVVDVTKKDSVEAMVRDVVATFGRIDYCANVAGIIRFGDTAICSEADFEAVYQVNLRGTFLCAKAEINAMLSQEPLATKTYPYPARGAIVNVASQAGLTGNGDLPAYVASKHGIVGLSKSDGLKYASQGIRVNALCPGTVETPMLGDLPQGDIGAKRVEERKKEIAMGRVGQPEEMAHCISFLTSGRSSFVTATTLTANGGLRI